jgi:hypothetical protein
MTQHNIFQALYQSFYSKSLYRDVANNWGGKAFLYLLMLCFLSWIGATVNIQRSINHGYEKNSDTFVAQIPVMTVNAGKISTPENRPYFIAEPNSNNLFAVIDTSGTFTTLEKAKADILVTQTEIMSKKSNETKIYQLPTDFNATIDAKHINGYVKAFIGYTWIFLLVFFVLASFVYRIIEGLVYSLIGKVFNAVLNASVSYGQILQIMLVAFTPTIVVSTLLDLFNVTFPRQLSIYFLLSMVYLFYGVLANKQK